MSASRAIFKMAIKRRLNGVPNLKSSYPPGNFLTLGTNAKKIVAAPRGNPRPRGDRHTYLPFFSSSSTALAATGMLVPGPKMAATPAL